MTTPRTLAEFIADQLAAGRSVRFDSDPTRGLRLLISQANGQEYWSSLLPAGFVATLPETLEMAVGNLSAELASAGA